VSDLTSRVTSAEGKITSQGQAITKLQGDLSSTTDKVNTKADQTALNALTGRVEKPRQASRQPTATSSA
jgi:uncharacterized coiled-coil protein SlyX